MRGRTNVTQRRQPVINGQIQQFVVESGNTIAKGDFVSVKMNDDAVEIALDDVPINKYIVDGQNGKYLINTHHTIYLIQCVGETITILDRINNLDYGTSYNWTTVYYNSSENIISAFVNNVWCFYSIVNDRFVLSEQLTNRNFKNLDSNLNYVISVIPYQNNYIVFYCSRYSGYSVENYARIVLCDTSVTTVISTISFASSFNSITSVKAFVINGKIHYVVDINYYSSSSSSSSYYCWFFYLIIENDTITKTDVFNKKSAIAIFNDDYTICGVNLNDTTKQYIFYVNNGVEYVLLSFTLVSSTFVTAQFIDQIHLVTIFKDTDNKFYFEVYEFDTQNETVSRLQHNLNDSGITTSLNLFVSSSVLCFMFVSLQSSSWGYKILRSNPYSFGIPSNKVKAYDGISAIGFAAGGGNAGSTIPVYIPLSN